MSDIDQNRGNCKVNMEEKCMISPPSFSLANTSELPMSLLSVFMTSLSHALISHNYSHHNKVNQVNFILIVLLYNLGHFTDVDCTLYFYLFLFSFWGCLTLQISEEIAWDSSHVLHLVAKSCIFSGGLSNQLLHWKKRQFFWKKSWCFHCTLLRMSSEWAEWLSISTEMECLGGGHMLSSLSNGWVVAEKLIWIIQLIKGKAYPRDWQKEKVVSAMAAWPLCSWVLLLFLQGMVVIPVLPQSCCSKGCWNPHRSIQSQW